MPFREELSTEFPVVVDFPVEHDDDGPVLVCHRLSAARDVNDTEPSNPEAHEGTRAALQEGTAIIRPAVSQRLSHCLQDGGDACSVALGTGRAAKVSNAEDGAHYRLLLKAFTVDTFIDPVVNRRNPAPNQASTRA